MKSPTQSLFSVYCRQEKPLGRSVTIDLARLNGIKVSPDKTVTGIGAGNRWIDIYSKLDPLGLAVPGGRVSTVGVGGLVSGGELAALSSWQVHGTNRSNAGVISSFSPNSALCAIAWSTTR